ncbi:hypothetical protein LOTGIDRAFT_160564 [Lottia gigantea]|uniref:Uncharacterized protein n=1 Tax=Lottia gigantea TaxID=225164 RepID=V4C1T9_LOTGI|nr:hypothetical protein LOTGIDRAFT_160564 [Lottia gigantea]ESO95424.1 hypothetical protein LOTGIDRAFT_160564 [Lottia gigantea]
MDKLFFIVLGTILFGSSYSQENTTTSCSDGNPTFDCFDTLQTEVAESRANNDTSSYCRSVKKYINCVEGVVCKCGMASSASVYRALTYYAAVYKQNGCEFEADHDLIVEPGITCQDDNTTEGNNTIDQGLLVLSLDTIPAVLSVSEVCPGVKTCYSDYSKRLEQALYNKDLDAACIGMEMTIPCIERAACKCQETNNSILTELLHQEQFDYNNLCTIITGGVFFDDDIDCSEVGPVSTCEAENPISDCYQTYSNSIGTDYTDPNIMCPAIMKFINCSESVACQCGLQTSASILHSLTMSTTNHQVLGCNFVTGDMTVRPGIQCPGDSRFNGSDKDAILISMGLLNNVDVIDNIKLCADIEECYIVSDSETAAALHNKDGVSLCQAQSNFIHCSEQAVCKCGKYTDREFQNWLTEQKRDHLDLCVSDTSIEASYTCDFCQETNQLSHCYEDLQRVFNKASYTITEWCIAVETFVKCVENVGCTCGIENDPELLKSISYYIHLYNQKICFFYTSGVHISSPGILCPGINVTGTAAERGLLVLSLETLPEVINLDRMCSGVKQCYKTFSDKGGIALYSKDLAEFCRANEDFLACYEPTVCKCDMNDSPDIVKKIEEERTTYNAVCSEITDKIYSVTEKIDCKSVLPVDECQISKPYRKCEIYLETGQDPNKPDSVSQCPGYKAFISCTEDIACKCGLQQSVDVLRALTLITQTYLEENCAEISGLISIPNGIPCPDNSPNEGSSSNGRLLSLGLLQASQPQAIVGHCSGTRDCFQEADTSLATALHERNASKLCKSHAELLSCIDVEGCKCNIRDKDEYKTWYEISKKQHKADCTPDTPVIEVRTCPTSSASKQGNGQTTLVQIYIMVTLLFSVILLI